jgi:hypothetical protein
MWIAMFYLTFSVFPLAILLLAQVSSMHRPLDFSLVLLSGVAALMVVWSDVQLAWHAFRHRPLVVKRRSTRAIWIIVAVFNLWVFLGFAFLHARFHYPEDVYIAGLLGMWAAIALAVDTVLIRKTLRAKHAD